jgi:two-component system, sensor histidine kinase and response regulator
MLKAKLLVVEDDPNLLVGLKDILELDHYQVLTAENGKQGLEILHREAEMPPDLIVSDIMMPQMDGLEFLRKVRQQDHWVKIPFIFLTAKGEKTDIQYGKVLGVDDYLVKPFDAEDLLVAVAAKLDRHRRIRDVQEGEISDLKRNILTILNHEFRTPLTLVVAYADMLKDYDTENITQHELLEFLKGVNSGAERLRRLIENFILLVELEAGDAERTFEWRKHEIHDLEEIIRSAQRQAGNEESRRRNFHYELHNPLPPIMGDHEYLTVAVRELIDNAIKFSKRDKPIRIGTAQRDSYVCLWVEDEGRGIPASEFDNIWKSFYQIDREIHEDQGTGTGLALVRGIVRLHQGKTELTSMEDKGSRFTLLLPALQID